MCWGTGQPHGLAERGLDASRVTCPEVRLIGSHRCHAVGARVRQGQVGKGMKKEEAGRSGEGSW